ncbi:MAG: hypothetical protein IPP94_14015 [Ignavibacteria bacterium]|nr:hypothetical protein [Ignavibacteria bacterium]
MNTANMLPAAEARAACIARPGRTFPARRIAAIMLISMLAVGFAPSTMLAQSTEGSRTVPHDPGSASIFVLARAAEDSVVLRWAPSTPHAWRLCNRIGYTVVRRSASGERLILTPAPLKPWEPEELMKAREENPGNRFISVAALALWSDTSLMGHSDSLGLDTLAANAEKNTLLHGYALFSADNDQKTATMLALRMVDRSVRRGEQYTYTVSIAEARDYRIAPGEVTVTAGAGPPAMPPPRAFTAEGLDGKIELRWEAPSEYDFTGYDVFRSEDGGTTFTKMTATPIVILRSDEGAVVPGGYSDTTITNYTSYTYRVQGIDAFGSSGAAAEVRVTGRDLTPPFMPFVSNPEQKGNTITLKWIMKEAPPDLAGFHILRSAKSDSGWRRITGAALPRSANTYTDPVPDIAEPFYVVSAIDTAGNAANSLPLYGFVIDTLPPAVPAGLTGSIDSSGVVTLRWHANRERNLLGYRVLWANALDHEFSQRTGQVWKDTVFVDTVEVNTLTSHVYYQVAAVNWNYNHSLPTIPLALERPDVVPPEAPVLSDVLASDTAVLLHWVPSGSKDLFSHELFRRVQGEREWVLIATLSRAADSYVDAKVRLGVMYEYQLEAVDSSGLRARAELPVQARPYDTGVRPAVENLNAVYDAERKAVVLDWRYSPREGDAVYYVIYRSFEDSPLLALTSAELGGARFVDTSLVGDGAYVYAVQVMTRGGAESPLSERARVKAGE